MVAWNVIAILAGSCLAMMLVERSGVRTTFHTNFKGDLKRETRWWSQYGQGACTLFVAAIIWQLDTSRPSAGIALIVATFGASCISALLKRMLGRVRPERDDAGRFLGPSLKHANYRESFPSSHSAAAIAMTVTLAHLYPSAAATFWILGLGCALLRYLMNAHWPSDVLGGVALGAAVGNIVIHCWKL